MKHKSLLVFSDEGERKRWGTRNAWEKWETETILLSDKFNSGTLGRNGVNRCAINEVR
jgi:hypothetical protein